MTLTQLEYIVALERLRHFGKAAEQCNIAQPSLSTQVQRLEDELKTPIFIRHHFPIMPTETGSLIIEEAKKVLCAVEKIKETIDNQKMTIEGFLRIGIIPTIAPYLLPYFLQNFLTTYPFVKLHIAELTTENILLKLRNGTLDIAIMATPLGMNDLEESFIYNEEFVAYVSKKEKLYDKKYIIASDIDVNSMWLLEEGHCLRSQVLNLCELQKNAAFEKNVEYECGSIETLKRFVELNGGITLLPELATIDMTPAKKLLLRYFKPPAPVREISMVASKSFMKKRLLQILKNCVMASLPMEIQKNKSVRNISIYSN
jgi:LysR family hydrogen peroxide-inducible transcriptional activator